MTRRSKRELETYVEDLEDDAPETLDDAHPVVRSWVEAGAEIPREHWRDPAAALLADLRATHDRREGGRSR